MISHVVLLILRPPGNAGFALHDVILPVVVGIAALIAEFIVKVKGLPL